MDTMISVRHRLHQLAERSGEEEKTKQLILSTLSSFAPHRIHTFSDSNNLVAEYYFGAGPTLLFRADIDAVGVDESLSLPYISLHKGISHKCGHDGHSTILLALAQRLHRQPLPAGRILLLFQSAEETGSGAALFAQSRFLDAYPEVHLYALHNIPGVRLGSVITKGGAFTCSVISCDIALQGKTSHAAEPHLAVSPYRTAQQITDKILSYNHPNPDDDDYSIATLIEFRVGSQAYGVTAGDGTLRFTIRTANDTRLQLIKREIETFVKEEATQAGLQQQIRWLEYFAGVENNELCKWVVEQAAHNLHYPIVQRKVPFAWGEDFGFLTQQHQGVLFGLGAGEATPPLHHPDYDFPDDLIAIGSNLFYEIAKQEVTP